jgi:hypothetical protein
MQLQQSVQGVLVRVQHVVDIVMLSQKKRLRRARRHRKTHTPTTRSVLLAIVDRTTSATRIASRARQASHRFPKRLCKR